MKALHGAPGTSLIGGRGVGVRREVGGTPSCQVTLTSEIITPIEPAGHGVGVWVEVRVKGGKIILNKIST